MITKTKLEELTQKYETVEFIKDDPIQFPHRFKNVEDIEIAAFLASLFAYGNRKVFIKKLDELFKIMENKPLEFVLKSDFKVLKGFNYRFAKDFDVIEVFNILKKLYTQDKGLKALFEYGYLFPSPLRTLPNKTIKYRFVRGKGLGERVSQMLKIVTDYFYANVHNSVGQGFYHLIPNPQNGGAMKRMNMFLRWMVRSGPVDLGLWDFIPTSELLIPLDVHVSRLSREMGLLTRNSNDFKAVLELTTNLKKIDPNDPAKFDFAIFGLGVNEAKSKK